LASIEREIVGLLPRLRRLARALARQAADADDLVQLTVERALARRDQWTPGTRLESWVFRIMKNAWIDESRARSRRGKLFAAEDEGERVGDAGAQVLEDRLAVGEVARAMQKLPEDQRLAVALVLVDGLSYKDAAEVLEVPAGTLTSRLVRGRAALLAELQGAA
jgi:RNA polymerase sigma-70 factor (ECF subfamily)